ncbi:MAG: ABC-type transporter, integral rane subunit [Bacteroidetes bacterium]|jgi:iron complex transport system permease protein|nr:ABC-type transporter, integral rane subunit [Bacteroidota bacterium]
MNSQRKFIIVFFVLLVAFCALFLLDIVFGSVSIPFTKVIAALFGSGDATDVEIIRSIRFPKAITAVLSGMSLSVCGILMQTLFRNPLAGPYVLGVNSGASLGVAIVMIGGSVVGLQNFDFLFQSGIVIASVFGALGVLLIVLTVSAKIRNNMGLLLAGIMIGQIVSALQSLLEYFSDADSLKNFVVWNLASIGNVDMSDLLWLAPFVILFSFYALTLVKDLDAMLLGEDYARSMGLHVKQKRLIIIIVTGVLSGVTTAFCGPIAFIGIAVPHICRILLKTSLHKFVIPACLVAGPCIMLLCDIICQLPSKGVVLPLNVITSIVGAPIVLYLLFKNYKFIN